MTDLLDIDPRRLDRLTEWDRGARTPAHQLVHASTRVASSSRAHIGTERWGPRFRLAVVLALMSLVEEERVT